jgi:PASTA domain
MNDLTATPVSTPKRDREARTGVPRGRLPVADHVGEMAAEAAQAIRRAGLRPALERSFGCDPELVGQVVSQEPPAGGELARNAIVTLYVAAPGPTPAGGDAIEPPVPPAEATVPQHHAERSVVAETSQPSAEPSLRRRRKPRPTQQAQQTVDTLPPTVPLQTHPAPSPALTEPDPFEQVALEDPSWPEAPGEDQLSDDGDDAETELDGLLDDELLARVEDLFSGRVGTSWRRAYPHRRHIATSHNPDERSWQ